MNPMVTTNRKPTINTQKPKKKKRERNLRILQKKIIRPQWEKQKEEIKKEDLQGFPGGTVVESLPANAGDMGSSPGLGGSHMPRSD